MPSSPSGLSRRTLFAGVGTAGALAAAVGVMPLVKPTLPAPAEALPKPDRGGGYVLSDHIKRYYKTAQV